MRARSLLPLLLAVLVSRPAAAQDAAPDVVERPRLVEDSPPRYPEKAWDAQLEADVVVRLTVGIDGQVTDVELVEPAGHGFDEEALKAARKLRFSPAKVNGVPTPVQIRYTFRFRVPEKETVAREPLPECKEGCPDDARKKARLRLTVYERGKGKRLPKVEVYFLDEDRVFLTDDHGVLERELAPGAYAITIRPPGFYDFKTVERLEEGEVLAMRYYVRRHRRERYKTIVWGTEGRTEVSRTSLVDEEIRSIPGTMGDPLRVTMLLPGSSAPLSGLGYPIIRGALPGDSIYEIDGIPVPMLYHLLFGTAVIHPRFTDEITFQPGGFGAASGRFPGGRIHATSARVEDDPVTVADLSLVSTSLLHARKIGENAELVAAARYGTLGYIIEGLAANTIFRYWDYQLKAAYRFPGAGKLTLTVLGVGDAAGETDPDTGDEEVLRVGFQRVDLRYRHAFGKAWGTVGFQVGNEWFRPPEEESDDGVEEAGLSSSEILFRPYFEAGYTFSKKLELRGGGDVLYQDFGLDLPAGSEIFFKNPPEGTTLGAWLAAEGTVGDLTVSPSVRVDHYKWGSEPGDPKATSIDPRLSASYAITPRLTGKAAAGVYHGPPRFSFVEPPIVFGPIPAMNGLGLEHGLNASTQVSGGIEAELPWDLEGRLTAFHHWNRHAIDFSLLAPRDLPTADPCAGGSRDRLPAINLTGRSYGVEAMVRRRLGQSVYGWISYAASRSERDVPGHGTIPFDFDQTHVLNTVVSWEAGRNWTLGAVFHYNTGRPWTPVQFVTCTDDGGFTYPTQTVGPVNSGRFPSYWRLDLRIQKREVYPTWYFDFYIDFFNAAFQWETIDFTCDTPTRTCEAETIPLFLPIIGIRGQF